MDRNKSPLWGAILQHGKQDKTREMLAFLRASPLFCSLSKRELRHIAAIVHQRTYQEGEFVFRKGQPGAAMFIVRSGEVEIIDHDDPEHEAVITTLGPNAFFGELALLDDSPRSASARARTTTEIDAFFRTDLDRLLAAFPQIGLQVYRSLALIIGGRLKETNAQLLHQ